MPAEADLLKEVPLFQLLDEAERSKLAEQLDVVRFSAGQTIFNVGDPGDAIYVISSGEAEVFFKNDTGERIVLEIASRPEMQCVFPVEVRFVKGDDSFLSPSHEQDTCYVAVHQDMKLGWEPYMRRVESLARELGGRPHWGKRHFRTAADLAPAYPKWDDFQAARKRLDPNGAFANSYTDRVLGPVP